MNDFFTKLKNFFISAGKTMKSSFSKIGLSVKNFFSRTNERTKEFFKNYSEKTKSEKAEKIRLKEEQNRKNENSEETFSDAEKIRLKEENEKLKKERQTNQEIKKQIDREIAKGIRLFFLNIFDVVFEIAFFCGIFFILRPDLLKEFLNGEKLSWAENFDFGWLQAFAFIGLDKSFANHNKTSIFIICMIFAVYVLYKLIFALVNSKRLNKFVSVLILVMNLVSLLLLKDKFLVFLIFYILLFFAFQFSCGINFATSRLKCLSILVFSFFAYIILLCVFSSSFRMAIFFLYEEIHLPKKWFNSLKA